MKFSRTLDLLLAGVLAVNSLPSVTLGQTNQASNSAGGPNPNTLVCKPYSPVFNPDKEDWKTIRQAQALSMEDGQRAYLLAQRGESFDLNCHRGQLQLRIEYKCGKNGGSGELRGLLYVDDSSLVRSVGLDRVVFDPLSIEETNLSKKTYEIDINESRRIVSYANTNERPVKSSFLGDKAEEVVAKGIQAIVRAAGEKVNLSDIEDAKKLLGEIVNYELDVQRQRAIQLGNHITGGNHVYLNEITWSSYSLLDKIFNIHLFDTNLFAKANDNRIPRKVVLWEVTIPLGEESIKGIILSVDVVGYRQRWLTGHRDTYKVVFSIPLDVQKELASRGIR
jgi:hypothetical protein